MKKTIFLFFIVFSTICYAQNPDDFIELIKLNSSIKLDIRYATNNNFLKKRVYPEARCFLRYAAAIKLDSIQKELETIGLGLKIFDGYRPLDVQKQMWKILPDNRYVANPKNGSRHNRGAAVDLTLVDSSGNELKMPSEYDDFSERAHHDYQNLPSHVKINRWILKNIMEKYGFRAIQSEWWHYDLIGWEKFPIKNLSFQEIDQISEKNN